MVNELRVLVPEHFMERMREVDNADKVWAEGVVVIAREMTARVRKMVEGVQLSARLLEDTRWRSTSPKRSVRADGHGSD